MKSTFRFRRSDTIGNPSAESDTAFLSTCFVDNGELDLLRDCENEQGIIVGRTGVGKTALLKMLAKHEERVIELDPHNLACEYISDSTIIQFFEALNTKMDLFYRLLWKHVFVVELLKKRFGLYSEEDRINFYDNFVYTLLRKKGHKEAFAYLNTWGTSFWETTEDRIKEITSKIETNLKAAIDVNLRDFLKMGVEGTRLLTEEQRREITQRGQEVVNKVQMSKLASLFDALDEEILIDSKKRYFIVIDRLDEDWVEDRTRYRMIRALIETMREINSKVRYAKMVIALRADLLDRVLKSTTDSGFQDEKYRGLCLPISWNAPTLEQLLDTRIQELIQRRYTTQPVTLQDLLPSNMRKGSTINYMLDRTLNRPRDLITFFNCCMERAEGQLQITTTHLLEAEGVYSQQRLRSLFDEWSVHYPCLISISNLLKKRPSSFNLSEIEDDQLADLCVEVLDPNPQQQAEDIEQIRNYFEGKVNSQVLRVFIGQVLYKVGMVGLKTASYKKVSWSNSGLDTISSVDIDDKTIVNIHKMFWRSLGIIDH